MFVVSRALLPWAVKEGALKEEIAADQFQLLISLTVIGVAIASESKEHLCSPVVQGTSSK